MMYQELVAAVFKKAATQTQTQQHSKWFHYIRNWVIEHTQKTISYKQLARIYKIYEAQEPIELSEKTRTIFAEFMGYNSFQDFLEASDDDQVCKQHIFINCEVRNIENNYKDIHF